MSAETATPKIRWAPRLRPALLKRLYELDAQGIHDTDLCDEVGTTLFARCQTYVLVSRCEVQCPRCGTAFAILDDGVNSCPEDTCGWTTTPTDYRESVKNYQAWPGRATDAFRAYYDRYPHARTYRERILLIDELVHRFHVSEAGDPVKSVASKLFEGNKKAVVQSLDELSALDPQEKERWRRSVSQTIDRRIVG